MSRGHDFEEPNERQQDDSETGANPAPIISARTGGSASVQETNRRSRPETGGRSRLNRGPKSRERFDIRYGRQVHDGLLVIFTTEIYLSAVNREPFPVNACTSYAMPGMSLAARFTKDSSGVGNKKGNSPFRSDLQVKMTCNGRFPRYSLPFNYDYFGSLDASSRSLQLVGAR